MRVFAFVSILLLLGGCAPGPDNQAGSSKESLTMQIYEVPAGNAMPLTETIQGVLQHQSKNGADVGTARAFGSNRIAVLAPESIQKGVRTLVEASRKQANSPPERAVLHYWLVSVTPAASTKVPASLESISEALGSITDNLGSAEFSRLDYVQQVVRAESGSDTVSGRNLKIVVRPWHIVDNEISADLRVHAWESNIVNGKTQRSDIDFQTGMMSLKAGETLVLGLVGTTSGDSQEAFQALVVRAEML